MSDSIRIERREKKIEVNDNGDFIILPLGNQEFIPKMLDLLNDFQENAKQQQERVEQISEMPEELEKVSAAASLNLEMCRQLVNRVNDLFGADACQKIFGVGVPSLFAFADFFDQLAPLIRKYADEESAVSHERVRKYSVKYKDGGINGG